MHRGAEEKAGVRLEHHDAVRLTHIPRGVSAAEMSADQQGLVRALLDVFVGRIPEELAAREAEKFAGDKLHDVHFAWAGGIERGQPHYYRLQGPRLLAEYDNTQRDANHIHTVWRDPEGDFGDDVLARHHAAFHASDQRHHRPVPPAFAPAPTAPRPDGRRSREPEPERKGPPA